MGACLSSSHLAAISICILAKQLYRESMNYPRVHIRGVIPTDSQQRHQLGSLVMQGVLGGQLEGCSTTGE